MKDNHTLEPWDDVWLDDDNGWIMDSQGNYLFEVITKDSEGYCASKKVATANARRVVAAVNACKGISTEALEKGVVQDMVDACATFTEVFGKSNRYRKETKI